MMLGMGGHQSARAASEDWITPAEIIADLGPFDLDPCASLCQPWTTAARQYTIRENGLLREWEGRVWLNPPYGQQTQRWLSRLAEHGDGIALIFARTETEMFFRWIWEQADALLFIRGRLYFYRPNGQRAEANAGAPSVLVAYGRWNVMALERTRIDGKMIRLTGEGAT